MCAASPHFLPALAATIVFALGFIAGRMGRDSDPGTAQRPLSAHDLHVMLSEDEHDRIAARWRAGGAI